MEPSDYPRTLAGAIAALNDLSRKDDLGNTVVDLAYAERIVENAWRHAQDEVLA